jgi:hypothetical protein
VLLPTQAQAGFAPAEQWTEIPYWGDKGTFFADVTGDGKADAIAVNLNQRVAVRPSNGVSFVSGDYWTEIPYWGTKGTFFADVDADGKADAIAVNNNGTGIAVRPSNGSSFVAGDFWTDQDFYGDRGTFFADVTGDGAADAIAVNNNGIAVRPSWGAYGVPYFWGRYGTNYEAWTNNAYYGDKGTFFADVNGDGMADAIAVNQNLRVAVRLSNGTNFSADSPESYWTEIPYWGTKGTFFADVTGDGKADAIAVNADKIAVRPSNGSSFVAGDFWTDNAYFGNKGTFFANVTEGRRADAIAVNDYDRIAVRRALPVPNPRYGLMPDFAVSNAPGQTDFNRVAESGAGTVRINFYLDLDRNVPNYYAPCYHYPDPNNPADVGWGRTDDFVKKLAEINEMKVLPVLIARSPTAPVDPPLTGSEPGKWSSFATALARRYGPGGWFWDWCVGQDVQDQPIRTWEVWNEENTGAYWQGNPQASQYASVLQAAHSAIRGVDPSAEVLVGGILNDHNNHNQQQGSPATYLNQLYNNGIAAQSEGVAVHPYDVDTQNVLARLDEIRSVMTSRGDSGTDMWVTEVGWSTYCPTNTDPPYVPANQQFHCTSLQGQVDLLGATLSALTARAYVRQAYWFSFREYARDNYCPWCGATGLLYSGLQAKPAWTQFLIRTGAY